MNVTTTVKKVVTDQTYATVGATDLVVETFRGYTSQIAALRSELEPKKVQARVKAAPTDAQNYYADLTKRGEDLVARLRKQKATQELIDQAEATVALGRGLVDTVRKAASDVERSAKTTLTVGRNEAAKASEAVADSVDVDTEKAKTAVADSAKRTTTAAKGTRTTAKKAANRTRTATKSTGAGAKKTAAKTAKAAEKSAEKTGN
ncbi:hypothetical protein O9K63_14030 [Janibacter cremeus]|uniref:hypothetical protein n=1 Tax=Janibacter cremeus TaxID=1285192 RepID=UPI0023F72E38|nr:hypothetical protein [Janibacter cremeus]WEV77696.1 hypothetical protein O9K63_14030 [Janibacter cremeus]